MDNLILTMSVACFILCCSTFLVCFHIGKNQQKKKQLHKKLRELERKQKIKKLTNN